MTTVCERFGKFGVVRRRVRRQTMNHFAAKNCLYVKIAAGELTRSQSREAEQLSIDFARQPLLGTDIAAFVFGVLAALFFVLWRRDRESGTQWLALAYALMCVHYTFDFALLPVGLQINPVSASILAVAASAFCGGLSYYLAAPAMPPRSQLALSVLIPMTLPLLALLGVPLYRPWGFLPFVLGFLVVVYATLQAMRREPRANHGWLALGMLAMPVYLAVVSVLGIDPFYVRYYFLMPAILVGLLLLTVSLLRRRRALEQENARRVEAERALTALNATLEQTVADRTADLQNIVAGLESFNRTVSHDLRGSLGGIAGLARVADDALQKADMAVARRVLPMIATQAEDSSQLVRALLSLARVSEVDVRKTSVDLNALTRDVVEHLKLIQAPEKSPEFGVFALPIVSADVDLLRAALTNLLANAIKFCMTCPTPRVEVMAEDNGRETIIRIKDNGVGFCPEAARSLFDPFVRLHGKDFTGHGVGLSIVRRAIERQGGRTWAEAKPGAGASFYFSLPKG